MFKNGDVMVEFWQIVVGGVQHHSRAQLCAQTCHFAVYPVDRHLASNLNVCVEKHNVYIFSRRRRWF